MTKTHMKFFLSAAFLALTWLVVFYDNIMAMEAIWRRSDTFAHGYFVFPIVLWLFWRDKEYLLNSKTQTSWLALPFIAGSLLVYLFSYAADINVLGQLSAVTCLISLFWLLMGSRLVWHYKFPLAYLIFLVPMGENLIPELQDITAWFTVAFLKLHGIPVFRDGLYIQVPNGLFEVAVACSGIRYLIASLAVGTLFGYLSYRSVKKQILFFIFALVLPIVANGIRAYLIVIIAYYSDMKYATGADHLVYGWVFFGFIIMLMFWLGGKFSDPELTNEESKEKALKEQAHASFSLVIVACVVGCFTIAYTLKSAIPVVKLPATEQPSLVDTDHLNSSNWGITFNHALAQSHGIVKGNIEIFRAVYANKQQSGELINHEHRLYKHESWTVVDQTIFDLNGHQAALLLLRNINGKERSIVYWYRVGEHVLLDPKMVKLYQAINLFVNPNQTSEVVAFSVTGADTHTLKEKVTARILDYKQLFIPISVNVE